ncbi:MAG: MATE family efflux transporter [Bacteroidales bacterium]
MSEDRTLLLEREDTGKLLIKYAFPAIVAMIAASLYHIVDSIFIGQKLGALAISGLALTFPLMNIAAAFGSLVGVGGATVMSIRLGEKDVESAKMVLGNVVILNVIIGIGLTLLILPFLTEVLYLFGGSDATIGFARDFMYIILSGNVLTTLYLGLNALLRASGYPHLAMYVTIFSVILNIILLILFILILDFGIAGAACATIIAQFVALVWLILILLRRNKVIHFTKDIFKLKKKIVIDIFSIGLSPFLMNLAATVVVILINYSLRKHGGDLAIGAYGIINRVGFIFVMVVLGITQGMQPIVGYNYGAKLYGRVLEVLKKGIILGVITMSIAFLLVELFPISISRAFTSDKELTDIASKGFRIVFILFPIIGFQIVCSNFFQSIGKAKKAIFLSLVRQVIVLIPLLIILPLFWGVEGVWLSMPASDLVATVITTILISKEIKFLKSQPLR